MREYKEYKHILQLWEREPNKQKIARLTGIPRKTVSDCIRRYSNVAGLEAQKGRASRSSTDLILERIQTESEVRSAYAYLLGLYLGDGYITKSKTKQVFRLRITLDKKYPNIIRQCVDAISLILPNNRPTPVDREGCYDISCFSKHFDAIFPQHGEGMKHQRTIKLLAWQQEIVDEYALEFFRGLYHSDGSRSQNIVNGKDYPRYQFTNMSPEIRQMFCDTCDKLGVRWSIANQCNVMISRRQDVQYLDQMVGAKD